MFNKKILRNIAATIVAMLIFILTDTVVSVLIGIMLNMFTRIQPDSLFFQCALRFITAMVAFRLISLAVNRIGTRNDNGHNLPEYIVSLVIIALVVIISVINLINGTFDIASIVLFVIYVLMGCTLFLDARKQLTF